MRIRENYIAWLFVAPVLILIIVYLVYPIIYSFYLSFTEWSGGTGVYGPQFIGIQNYINLFDVTKREGHYFLIALKNTFIWTILFVILPISAGLLIAIVLNTKVRGSSYFKIFFYFPMVLSFIVLGLIWKWLMLKEGLINSFLIFIGLENLTQNFLGNPRLALYSVIVAASWRHTAYCMVIFLAGLKVVPVELVEAAKIDGANNFQSYTRIILPLLRPATMVVVTTTIISSFTVFDIIFAMTRGGPSGSSHVLGSLAYQEAFWNLHLGLSSAIVYIMFFLVACFSIPYCLKMIRAIEESH